MTGMPIEFESPWTLAVLLALPFFWVMLRYTLVDTTRGLQLVSAFLRAAIVVLLVLALAQTLWKRQSDDVAVIVLADLSDSAPEGAKEELNTFLDDLEERVSNPSMAGLVVFAENAAIATPVQNHATFPDEVTAPEEGGDTSIEAALAMAQEMAPTHTLNRVVLFSDGNETRGDALKTAKQAATRGMRIYTMPYTQDERDEVLLEDLIVPPEVKQGQSFSISLVAHSAKETEAQFALYRNGFKVDDRTITLKAGSNSLVFEETNPADGLSKYEVRVTAKDDFYADNNVASGIVYCAGEPRVLLLEGDEREGRHLARALEAENIHVDLRESKGMPGTLEDLAAYDAVVFSDVPATDLSVRQMQFLRSYVEDLGGGFVMLGGEESFGLGGYYRTAVEEIMPLRMRSEKKKDTPSLAMMLVIDKSGSMNGEKMELAKEAAIAAVELLGEKDYIGVVAFDGEPYWVTDLQSAGNRMGIIQTIESIQAEGGTSIYPAMAEAYNALSGVSAAFKHVVLLTDGQSQPGDFAGIVDNMVSEQMTVSTVGIGEGADTVLLQDMARWGRGRYYFTADPYDVPQIFAKETMTASKSSMVEEPFLPQVMQDNQIIQSIDWATTPFLFGYVVCTAKPTAAVPLITERGDPLLATWRYGLGKTLAFTSDAKSRWASDWLNWPGYRLFWAQVIRDVMRTRTNLGAEARIAVRGNEGRLVIDAANDQGAFVNGLASQVQIVKPDLTLADLTLRQTAPGRYESDAPLDAIGSYLFKFRQTYGNASGSEDESAEPAVYADFTRGVTISYKPEYRHLSTNETFMQELADVSHGRYKPTMDDIFAVDESESVPIRERIWPGLLIAALLLFILDVALRRLDLAGWKLFGQPERYG